MLLTERIRVDRFTSPLAYPPPACEETSSYGCKAAFFGAYKRLGLMRLHETVRGWYAPPSMTIFLLHRVTDRVAPDGLTVGSRWFREFCGLMKSSYHVTTLGQINRLLKAGETPPPRTVAITFDDSYADNHEAAGILSDHGLPATFFVPTRYVDTDLRYPWDEHLPAMGNLTWSQLREMADAGHEIGSHSVTHPDFSALDEASVRTELVDSKRTIEDRLGRPVRHFAFPYGAARNFRADHARLVADAGYDGAFSAIRGFVEPGMAGQILPRQAVPYFRNLTHLELHINRCLDWVYRFKRRTTYA